MPVEMPENACDSAERDVSSLRARTTSSRNTTYHRLQALLHSQLQRSPIAAPQLLLAVLLPRTAVDGSHRMGNVLGGQIVTRGEFDLAGLGAVEQLALVV